MKRGRMLSTEELAVRCWDKREIQNLAGKYVMSLRLRREETILDNCWSEAEDVCLGFNDGFYVGPEAVAAYFLVCADNTAKRAG